MPEKGLTVPLGGTGILISSGLSGIMRSGSPSIRIRFAELLYDAGMISMISFRGNSSEGMSVALHAIRYP